MRFYTFILLAWAHVALAAAQGAGTGGSPGLPPCANSCISGDFGGCGNLDVKCICSNKSLIDNLTCCVSTACSAEDQASYKVTDLPKSATCAPGLTAPTPAGSATGPGSSASGSALGSTTGTAASASSSGSRSATSATAASSTSGSTGSGNKIEAAAFAVGALFFGALAAM